MIYDLGAKDLKLRDGQINFHNLPRRIVDLKCFLI